MAGSAQELRPESGRPTMPVRCHTGLGLPGVLMGEMHGVKENAAISAIIFQSSTQRAGSATSSLKKNQSNERDAQAYVEGGLTAYGELCLRANIIDTVRQLNQGRAAHQLIRIHLGISIRPPMPYAASADDQGEGSRRDCCERPRRGGHQDDGLKDRRRVAASSSERGILGELAPSSIPSAQCNWV